MSTAVTPDIEPYQFKYLNQYEQMEWVHNTVAAEDAEADPEDRRRAREFLEDLLEMANERGLKAAVFKATNGSRWHQSDEVCHDKDCHARAVCCVHWTPNVQTRTKCVCFEHLRQLASTGKQFTIHHVRKQDTKGGKTRARAWYFSNTYCKRAT